MPHFLLAFAALSLPAWADDTRSAEVRAIWVTRFEYRTDGDVRTILRNCAALGFNTVLFQVRGQADAYYRSSIEPWADRLGGRDPGWDPLAVACEEARRLGLSLHAWMNVMPAWRGKAAPPMRDHIVYKRPDWIVVDRQGRRQTFNDHYVCLNPCLPEVREYLAAVAAEIAARYPIDGLHLDYIRFIEGDWSYDKATMAIFHRRHGAWPSKAPALWDAFRREAVTATVEAIRTAVKSARPDAQVTAAVYPTAAARARVLQDAEVWARRGLIDWVAPMTYDADDADYREAIEEGFARLRGVPCFPGVGAYKHGGGEQTSRQIRMARVGGGFAVFSYSSLFVSPDESRREDERACRSRREAVARLLGGER